MSKFKKFYEKYYEEYLDVNEKEFKSMFKKGKLKDGLLKNMLKTFNEKKVKTVCDIGCGYGYITSFIKKQGFEVDGVDISEVRIKRAKKINPGPDYLLRDVENKQLRKKYDAIYALNVIEHIFDYDLFLKNIYNSLNEGGLVIIGTPNILAPRTRLRIFFGKESGLVSKSHIHFFTIKNLREVLSKNGFRVYKVLGFGKLAFLSLNMSGNLCVAGIKTKE